MPGYIDLKGMKTFKEAQDKSNEAKFASLVNGLVKDEQLADSLADDVVMVHVDSSNPNKILLYRDDKGTVSTQLVEGEYDKIYIDVDSTLNGYYYWNGEDFILKSTALSAINDANGEPITDYVKNIRVLSTGLEVTLGNGTKKTFTIQSPIDQYVKSLVYINDKIVVTDSFGRVTEINFPLASYSLE